MNHKLIVCIDHGRIHTHTRSKLWKVVVVIFFKCTRARASTLFVVLLYQGVKRHPTHTQKITSCPMSSQKYSNVFFWQPIQARWWSLFVGAVRGVGRRVSHDGAGAGASSFSLFLFSTLSVPLTMMTTIKMSRRFSLRIIIFRSTSTRVLVWC